MNLITLVKRAEEQLAFFKEVSPVDVCSAPYSHSSSPAVWPPHASWPSCPPSWRRLELVFSLPKSKMSSVIGRWSRGPLLAYLSGYDPFLGNVPNTQGRGASPCEPSAPGCS